MEGEHIEGLREELGVSNEKFASILGVSVREVYYWKSDKRKMPVAAQKFLYVLYNILNHEHPLEGTYVNVKPREAEVVVRVDLGDEYK